MAKPQEKKMAIDAIVTSTEDLKKYMDDVKDKPLTDDIKQVISDKSRTIRYLVKGLVSGYYDG